MGVTVVGRAATEAERRSSSYRDRGGLTVGLIGAVALVIVGLMLGRLTVNAPAPSHSVVDGAAWGSVAGVPAGHPATRAGAVAAAADYAQTLAMVAMHSDRTLADVQRETFTRAALATLAPHVREQAAAARSALAGDDVAVGGGVLDRHVPIGYRLLAFDRTRAVVALWSVDLAAARVSSPARAWWMTERITLLWQQDRWRISHASAGSGPVPAIAQPQPSSARTLRAELQVTSGLRHAG
jgi:hypothetical protein